MNGADAVVDIRDFAWRYRGSDSLALDGATFAARRGECVVVAGASGCGKSTLVSVMNGLVPHFHEGSFSGEATVCGVDVLAAPTYEVARHVGSVFQDPRSQFFATTTTDEVAFGCENLGLPREETARRVDGAFAALGAEDLRDCSIFELSSGQKQKVAIASALALRPELLVMDEPSANLDNAACAMLADAVARVVRAGCTVVVAEHRLGYLADVADRVVLMERGRVAGELTRAEARALSWEDASARGLRLANLAHVPLPPRPVADGSGGQAPVLQVSGLAASYGRRQVLAGVDVACAGTAEVTAVIGENGAGKTTLLRALCGLKREAAGSVALGGQHAI